MNLVPPLVEVKTLILASCMADHHDLQGTLPMIFWYWIFREIESLAIELLKIVEDVVVVGDDSADVPQFPENRKKHQILQNCGKK